LSILTLKSKRSGGRPHAHSMSVLGRNIMLCSRTAL